MKFKHSLTQKLAALLVLFVAFVLVLLVLFVVEKNRPVGLTKIEKSGNSYQRGLQQTLRGVMFHRILAQRALYGDAQSKVKLEDLQKEIDNAFNGVEKLHAELSTELQLTDDALKARQREHYRLTNIRQEWTQLKEQLNSLKAPESNSQHAHIIADLRTLTRYLGHSSHLAVDSDVDSRNLVDVTLVTLPTAQDNIQNAIIDLEPIFRRQAVTPDEQAKAKGIVSLMSDSDIKMLRNSFETLFAEDMFSHGKTEGLEANLKPEFEKFITSHQALINVLHSAVNGKPTDVDSFVRSSEEALKNSFDLWAMSSGQLDNMFEVRIEAIHDDEYLVAGGSLFLLLVALGAAVISMRFLVRDIRQIVSVLSNTSTEVSSASGQCAVSSSTLSETSSLQAASLQQTMASVEEISAMVSQNAESANKTKQAVDANQKVSELGSQSVNEMLAAIGDIKQTNEDILTQMEAGNKEFGVIVNIISEIGEKTKVINEIVFQTKLLSFNASVEAARAGEHGKGFAVVAEEVGNLAQMSGNAAQEISDMLSNSIKNVNDIVAQTSSRVDQLVEVGKDKIVMGQATAQKCREALTKMTENATTVAGMIGEITNASREQAQGIQEINKAISQLDKVTQQNTAVAQGSSVQAEHLKGQSQVLSSAIERLVGFVDGGKHAKVPVISPFKQEQKTAKVVPIRKKTHAPVPVVQAKAHAKPSVKKQPQAAAIKKAAGEVPASNHPDFEDF